SANLSNVRLYSNTAQGGDGQNGATLALGYPSSGKTTFRGGPGGNGLGGGLYVAGGSVSLHHSSADHNSAIAGTGGSSPTGVPKANDGLGPGGGLDID